MNDLLRAIFGIPSYDQHVKRMDNKPPKDDCDDKPNNRRITGDVDDNDDDDDDGQGIRIHPRSGIFGFPLFADPIEIHKQFDKLVEEMNKAFGFGVGTDTGIVWGDDNTNSNPPIEDNISQPQVHSLRDEYLKQPDCGYSRTPPRDDYDAVMNNYEAGSSRDPNMEIQVTYPKTYSKSVYIQTVRRPDGTVETIKKIRDHKGNEETTITHSNVSDPLPPPSVQDEQDPIIKEDSSGLSIFKKFFPF